jgi:hypothetical protein
MCGLVPAGPQLVLQARLVVRHQLVQQEVRKYLRLRLDGIVTLRTPEHKHICSSLLKPVLMKETCF